MTETEIIEYYTSGTISDEQSLKERFEKCILSYFGDKEEITLQQYEEYESILLGTTEGAQEVRGISAYAGIVQGIARVIHNPKQSSEFNEGDILVTGMTRPEFLPLFKKAAGIVTDVGGMLSHAAITARELKKPCVIGTQTATKILKDGYRIEVNAEKGVVKILE